MIVELIPAIMAATLGLLMLIAWRMGLGLGIASRLRGPGTRPSKFDDASMALVGLLLAFSFGISISKYDQRRLAVVADSNAIGDFYTCATLLQEPTRTELRHLIRQYTELRVNLTRRRITHEDLEAAVVQFLQMQGKMTGLVGQALREGTPIAVPLTNSLNELTSNHAARVAAIRDQLPLSVLGLLCVSAIVTALLIGREQGVADAPEALGTICFILMVTLAIYTTIDMNQGDRGLIKVSQEPMERLYSSMGTE